MRTYSTPQSALVGEITKLAIVECVASAALYVCIGVYLGTFKYLAIAVIFAPLMLFRTDFSANWGLQLYKQVTLHIAKLIEHPRNRPGRSNFVLTIIILPLIGTTIRIISTMYWAVRCPLQTLRDAPQNWLRQSLCTDFAHPPEIVPKEAVADNDYVISFQSYLQAIREAKGSELVLVLFAYSPFLILGWIPSVIYRLSFKATALAYVPLVWAAHSTLRNPLPPKARLERITKGELEKVRRGLSWIILTTLVGKIALIFGWLDRSYVESKFPSQKIVTNFVVLDGWPWWQITLGADALLTFILFFFADAALPRIEGQQPWREESVLTIAAAVSFLRASLAIVTISHFFHVALVATVPDSVRHLVTF